MKVRMCHWPKRAWPIRPWPAAARPAVLGLVASIKTGLSGMLAIPDRQALIQTLRPPARSGRRISQAGAVIVMAKARPAPPSADQGAMHRHTMNRSRFGHDPVRRQGLRQAPPDPAAAAAGSRLALRAVALPFQHAAETKAGHRLGGKIRPIRRKGPPGARPRSSRTVRPSTAQVSARPGRGEAPGLGGFDPRRSCGRRTRGGKPWRVPFSIPCGRY